MAYRLTLRTRLIVAFALLSTTVAVTLAIIAHTVMEMSEANLVEKTILQEARMLARSFTQSPDFITEKQQHFTLYVSGPGREDPLPEELRKLGKSELHTEVEINGIEYELIQIHMKPYTYYFLYDFTQYEIFEYSVSLILFVSVLICISLGIWIGLITSNRVIMPVRRLAASFEKQPDQHGIVDIPQDFTNDEVGMLARKFMEYNDRIRGYIEREKSFTSNASHELRTPLSVIAGAAEVLENSDLPQKDRNAVARIRHEAQVMAELINLLLILSRDPGQLAAADEKIDVNATIRDQLYRIREECAAKGIALEFIENARLSIRGSKQALDVVLGNLLNNSVQYTARGKITVSVEQDFITVEDTGPGISPDIRNRIFERFFRGEPGKIAQHSGVGLALVKQLCTLCKWNISLDAGTNAGTRFIFKLGDKPV
jgi:signal transduction histidine kinase